MPKITSLEKKKHLYKCTFDDNNDEIYYVTEDTIVKFLMSRGASYSENEVREIIRFSQFSRGKNLAIYFISFKSRTKAEVEKYLIKHEISEDEIPTIIDSLIELRFIDDEKYATSYIEGKLLAKKYGPYLIKQKLYQKGIDDDLIADKINELYDEELQIEIATKQAEKLVLQKFSRLPFKILKNKISQGLVSKGFSYSIAAIAWENLEIEQDDENEQDLLALELEKFIRKYSRKYDGRELSQKLIQALMRKGFDYGDSRDAVGRYEFEDGENE